jgi:hypothetical protein
VGKMKKNLTVGLLAVIVVIIVVAAGFYAFNNGNDEQKNSDISQVTLWNGSYHIGDYMEDYYNDSNGHGIGNATITAVSSDMITVHYILDYTESGPNQHQSYDYNFPTNASFAFNQGPNWSHDPSDMDNYEFVASESIQTKWGALDCQHFKISDPSQDYSYWTFNGVVIKYLSSTIQTDFALNNSNLAEIINH